MKKQKGISLIVLIITIIVVIILATAVIVTIATNNPIGEANKARYESDRESIQAVFTSTVAKVMTEHSGNVEIIALPMNSEVTGVDKAIGEVIYIVEHPENKNNIKGKIIFDKGIDTDNKYYTGVQLPIYSVGETKWYVDEEGVISLKVNDVKYGLGEQIEILKAGEKATKAKNKFLDNEENVAIIPIDFIVVPGCETISKGLVISDDASDTEVNKQEDGNGIVANGNQFVWVPVSDMSTFIREEGYEGSNLQSKLKFCTEPLNYNGKEANEEEKDIYHKMMESVIEYKGFYIGRYEASNDGNSNVQSKKNKEPWVNIPWSSSNEMDTLTGGVLEKARKLYQEENASKGKAVSILPFGVQWDETVRFMEKNYPGIEKDSTGYGNSASGRVIPTGSKENYAVNHIYDMTGNVMEWTMEACYSNTRVARGGVYNFLSIHRPVTMRLNLSSTNINVSIGFRVALYISV